LHFNVGKSVEVEMVVVDARWGSVISMYVMHRQLTDGCNRPLMNPPQWEEALCLPSRCSHKPTL
jgi:hypothetical protein